MGTRPPPPPYAGEETREIKALTAQEVEDLLGGEGMGLAKPAELNGYPGPRHVLDLAEQLSLTPDQLESTRNAFARMKERAMALGAEIVEAERGLDDAFASRQIDSVRLAAAVARISTLRGSLRVAHLEAHIEMRRILSDDQARSYARLRGYHAGH